MRLSIGHLGTGDQSLGGNAAEIQAVAAHLVTFQQDHIRAHLAGTRGHRQTARACTDHQNIRLNMFQGLVLFALTKGFYNHRGRRQQA